MTQSPSFLRDSTWLEHLLSRIPQARVADFGDLCLDAYWLLDAAAAETSLETGLAVHKVQTQRYSPGGAGNVAANLAALGVGHIELIGLVGADPFGDELIRQLAARGLPADGVLRGPEGWQTLVYAKPYRGADELNRLDFGGGNPFAAAVWPQLLARLETAATRCPVVIINQQVPTGWAADAVPTLNALIARHPQTLFIVDSRHHAERFASSVLKLNTREAARLLGETEPASFDEAPRYAEVLARRQGRPVFVTRGEQGLVLAVDGGLYEVPGIEMSGAIDPVGAGDTALAALAASFAVGAAPLEAGMLANLAAAITTRQVRTTGTATPAQLRTVGAAPDYIHSPRLAAQPRLARYLAGTRIELVTNRRPGGRIRHAILDHDGTISTLRQGWEAIMEPMMVKAVLGRRPADIGDGGTARVVAAVHAYVDRTTGVQTLAQMKGLADLVREFGYVATSDILNEHGYKAVYNDGLFAVVHTRLKQLERGERGPEDWLIKNAGHFLERLRAAGVTLYLVSGSDQADVVAEARALGYGQLFSGGIHGAVGDLRIEAKRSVLERIIKGGGIGGDELVVIGDGPVEIREGRRCGAFTVGVASDEVRRQGIDLHKRARLIRAGADVIVPDFTELDALLGHLGLA
jgi:rfaE bifunctional protein kinase chain/domain